MLSKHLFVSITMLIKPAFAPAGTTIPADAVMHLRARIAALCESVGSANHAHSMRVFFLLFVRDRRSRVPRRKRSCVLPPKTLTRITAELG